MAEAPAPLVIIGAARSGTNMLRDVLTALEEEIARHDTLKAELKAKIDEQARIPIHPIERLESFVKEQDIYIGIIAVPESAAMPVFEQMIASGISGFLNFTPVELKCAGRCHFDECPNKCTIQNVNISLELESLFYLVHLKKMGTRQ